MLKDATNGAKGRLLLALSTGLLMTLAGCQYAPAPTPTAAPAVTETVALGPIDTPAPTATIVPTTTPTSRPSPTATPTVPPPTATPTPAQAEAGRYVEEMEAIAARWEEFRVSSDTLITEVDQNFFAICFTRSGEIDQQIATGRQLLQEAGSVEPPDDIAEVHERLLEEGSAGLDALEEGKAALCQRLDTSLALQRVEEANEHLAAAYATAQELFDWVEAEGLVP